MNGISKRLIAVVLSAVSVGTIFTPAVSAQGASQGLLGDANLDGKISLKDASLVQRVSVNLDTLSREQAILADVDGSDSVTLKDAFIIQRFSLSIKDNYPKNTNDLAIGDTVSFSDDTDIVLTDTDTEDTDSIVTETDTEDTDSIVTETDTENTDSIVTETDTEDTDSIVTETDTENTDSIVTETDTEDTDSVISETDTEDTDSEVQVDVRSLEEINAQLNGNFENWSDGPKNWTVLSYNSQYISQAQGEGVNATAAMKISTTSTRTVFLANCITGLEPNADYKVTAMVKGDNITANRDVFNGVQLDVGNCLNARYVVSSNPDGSRRENKGYMIHSENNWQKGTFRWTQITCYFVSDSRGCADIVCLLDGQGTAYFDNIKIEKADFDSEVTDKVRIKGRRTGIVMDKAFVDKYNMDDLRTWVGELDDAYDYMADLMGAKPFYGDRLYFVSTEEPDVTQFQALACINPIRWSKNYMEANCKARLTEGMKTRVAYHEMGHVFDMMYYVWRFDTEVTADYKASYVALQLTDGVIDVQDGTKYPVEDYLDAIKSKTPYSYEKTIAQRDTSGCYIDALDYIMVRTSMAVGWDTVKAVFKDFNNYYDEKYTKQVGKFFYWAMCLQNKYNETHPDATGYEVYNSFPEGEYDYFKSVLIKSGGYDEEQGIYAVKYVDPDGKPLWFEFVPYGSDGTLKAVSDHEKYGTFTGWDRDITNIRSDMTVTALYSGFSPKGNVTCNYTNTQPYEGEFAEFTVNPDDNNTYTYNIIAYNGDTKFFESGYSSEKTAKIFLAESGDITVVAKLKDTDGNEFSTLKLFVKVGRAATVYYSGFDSPYIHYKDENGEWTTVPGKPMTPCTDAAGYSYKYVIPVTSSDSKVEICFNDGKNNWDSNNEKNYTVGEGAYGIKDSAVTLVTG